MRRLLVPEGMTGCYHVVSRVVDRRIVLGGEEKAHFLRLLKGYAVFCGVRLLAWCLMGNHFHLLVEVPPFERESLTSVELLRRLRAVYTVKQVAEVRRMLEACGATDVERRRVLDGYAYRMGSLSEFMKTLLQRFTRWFNRRQQRDGYLWSSRFRSVVVENGEGSAGHAARVVAAYIDLNPVRAGLVEDPAEYRWSGYGMAVGCGDAEAVAGLRRLWGQRKGEALASHRVLLFGEGSAERVPEAGPKSGRAGIAAEKVAAEEARGGRMSLAEVLRFRVRYLTAGGVVGSRGFVERVGRSAVRRPGVERHSIGSPMRFAIWGGMHALRKLRTEVVAVPA
jgi:hypothetical protein